MPLALVVAVGFGAQRLEHRGERNRPEAIGFVPSRPSRHGSWFNRARSVTQSFMLKRWLVSVSRSMSAAVR